MEDVTEYNRYEIAELIQERAGELDPLFEYLELSIKTSKASESISTIIEVLKSDEVSPTESYLIMKKIISETDYYSHIFSYFIDNISEINFIGTDLTEIIIEATDKIGDSFNYNAHELYKFLKNNKFKGRSKLVKKLLKNPHLSDYHASYFRKLL